METMIKPFVKCVACGAVRTGNGEDVACRVHQLEAENKRMREALECLLLEVESLLFSDNWAMKKAHKALQPSEAK